MATMRAWVERQARDDSPAHDPGPLP
jgi:hypothetical protein